MRTIHDPQMKFGAIDIAAIELDLKSRDDIPPILRGLQYIYATPALRAAVFKVLERVMPSRSGPGLSNEDRHRKADPRLGRPGMEQWKILVLGVLRLGLNSDYDRIHELANHHDTIRQMLGHGGWEDKTTYNRQTIKDNLRLFTPEILDEINQLVVKAGHGLVKKNAPKAGPTRIRTEKKIELPDSSKALRARCDSFVVETDVHYPTDINLLFDAVRKTIEECVRLSQSYQLEGWRQYRNNLRQFKKQYRLIQKLRPSTSKVEQIKRAREEKRRKEYLKYVLMANGYQLRVQTSLELLEKRVCSSLKLLRLREYMGSAKNLMSQIIRRVCFNETIPHHEKIFSIFEPHTEWISKGKAGVPVELGLRVNLIEDQHQYILHHQVMRRQTDEKVAVEIVEDTKKRFPELAAVSWDKGAHSPQNQRELKALLDLVVLPKKGKLSKADRQRENSLEFKLLRRQHSAVESAINALEVHGLDRCPDHGIKGFERYVALAVLAKNIHRLGTVLREQQKERQRRKRGPYKKAA